MPHYSLRDGFKAESGSLAEAHRLPAQNEIEFGLEKRGGGAGLPQESRSQQAPWQVSPPSSGPRARLPVAVRYYTLIRGSSASPGVLSALAKCARRPFASRQTLFRKRLGDRYPALARRPREGGVSISEMENSPIQRTKGLVLRRPAARGRDPDLCQSSRPVTVEQSLQPPPWSPPRQPCTRGALVPLILPQLPSDLKVCAEREAGRAGAPEDLALGRPLLPAPARLPRSQIFEGW